MTTGTNQFVPFATGTGANVYSNSDYSGLTARSTGVANGVADPKAANNAWRQGSVMAAAIGRFISLMGYDALDDGDITTLEAHFEAALAAKIAGGQAVIPTASLIHVGADTGTVNALVADVTPDVSSWVDGQVYVIRPANTTTSTAPTFKPDALTAKTIVHPDGSALLVGEIVGGAKCILIYDGTLDKVVLVCTRAYVDQSIATAVAGTLIGVQKITASGTYTPTTGAKRALVFATGGGGSGTSGVSVGTGGGAGSTAIAYVDLTSVSTVTCTIGAGGVANSGGGSGTAGGTTSFGSYAVAGGGAAGVVTSGYSQGVAGGTATTGTMLLAGAPGGSVKYVPSSIAGGDGGSSFWGGGGLGSDEQSGTNHVGGAGLSYGAGGGGGDNSVGGNGAAGVILVLEFK